MPVSQSRLLACILLSTLSAASWADVVIVDTVADENKVDNSLCSLREAVVYIKAKNAQVDSTNINIALINQKISVLLQTNAENENEIYAITTKPEAQQDKARLKVLQDEVTANNTTIKNFKADIQTLEDNLQKFRDTGLNGCKTHDGAGSDTITLNTPGAYILSSPITIDSSLNIKSSLTFTEDSTDTLLNTSSERTLFKPSGVFRLFIIDDGKANYDPDAPTAPDRRISVTFTNIDFQGCNQSACANEGGIFYNAETLTIIQSVISGGIASANGGAIYSAAHSAFTATQVLFQQNKAADGAAIYSQEVNLLIQKSLFLDNNASNIVKVINKSATADYNKEQLIENSTFAKNNGIAISAHQGLTLNSLTVILNNGGISYNNDVPAVFNSIIAGNNGQDCLQFGALPNNTTPYFTNNIFQNGCNPGIATHHNRQISGTGDETLIADSNNDGICDRPPAVGLLCPLATNGGLTQSFKPRLLVSYRTIDDAPIVNKAYTKLGTNVGKSCSTSDQRDKPRLTDVNGDCDIGAVELQDIGANTVPHQGQDITYGQKAVFDLYEKIGDGELLPAAYCQNIHGPGNYLDGCVYSPTKLTKGFITFDGVNHTVSYQATLADFHGYEDFDYYMTTTITRFSDASNSKAMKVNVRVVSDPPTKLQSKSLDTGASSLFSLLIMGCGIFLRRRSR